MALLGASEHPHYCTSICNRSCCTRRANCVDLINKNKKATPALPCDGHVEPKSDAGCGWSRKIKASGSVSLAGSCSETGV